MYLQVVEMLLLLVAIGVLAAILIFISRRQPPAPEQPLRYTPGEQEIIRQIGEMRERLDKVIPPYGRVGYIPSSIEELKDLLGFTYVKLGNREIGSRPPVVENFENLDVDFLQSRVDNMYVYIVRRGGKKLVAVGEQYLDYLTARFLSEFLDYI